MTMARHEPGPICGPIHKVTEVRVIRITTDVARLQEQLNQALQDGFEVPHVLGTLKPDDVLILQKWEPCKDEEPAPLRPIG
jgi:hypothetical protein